MKDLLHDHPLLRHDAFIDGEWQGADNGATFEVVDPSNGASLGTVPDMGATETHRAIDAANAAGVAQDDGEATRRDHAPLRLYLRGSELRKPCPVLERRRISGHPPPSKGRGRWQQEI